jgi:hypothetical protein
LCVQRALSIHSRGLGLVTVAWLPASCTVCRLDLVSHPNYCHGLCDRVTFSVVYADGWGAIKASPIHQSHCRSIWEQAGREYSADDTPFETIRGEDSAASGPGATPYTTGLGLPLSRALAKAGGC